MRLNRILDLLRRAEAHTSVVWGSPHPIVVKKETVSTLQDTYKTPFFGEKIVQGGKWTYGVGVYQEVQEWIKTHWIDRRRTKSPTGCVVSDRPAQFQSRDKLDNPTAARKLILAAMLHGPGVVAPCAMRFAKTGLLEVETIYLLKGPSVETAVELDDYCTLIPYREALKFRKSLIEPLSPGMNWPPANTNNICALRARGFESPESKEGMQYMSSLLRPGHPENLALLLGVVWGNGYSVIGHWSLVPLATSAALPFWSIGPVGGSLLRTTLLRLQIGKNYTKNRPLARQELAELVETFGNMNDQNRKILSLAMRRLRDSAGRIDFEDMIIDLCIALEVLFTDNEWESDLKKTISGRGSWYYADTVQERDGSRRVLKNLYETRRNIVHGNTIDIPLGPRTDEESSELIGVAENILRSCLKCMISNGIPDDWEASKDHRSIWRDPPRLEQEIPSNKSDSLSWSVQEQKEIDIQLEKVWKPTISKLPERPAKAPQVTEHHTQNLDQVQRYRERGIPCVVAHPARLYMAHPKWPKQSSDELDNQTLYYCERDVGRHLEMWIRAATQNRADCFVLGNFAEFYHPSNRNQWLRPLE